ncbi:winged-helix domain-containing protein [Methylocapsa acidiphila]|uniref:winged-helix domain-containing protein n=1 Tax=Methylocapsa acidiphila TaxID=133552 RepID=UPI00040AA74E|nr:winged-helix domain-containing protein [Methylocapsa acidiphila]
MNTSLDRIRERIAELEAKINDLRIAERELQALEKGPAKAAKEPAPRGRPGRAPKRTAAPSEAEPQPEGRQTIGAAIAEVLDQHGALSVAEIAEQIKAAGRDISNRTVSFSLQALKKRGLVKGVDGKWTLPKARAKRTPA